MCDLFQKLCKKKKKNEKTQKTKTQNLFSFLPK